MKYLTIILFLIFSFNLNAQRHFHVAVATEEEEPGEVDSLEYYITDGNALAWFISNDSVVYNGADSVMTRWGDYLNSGLYFSNSTGAKWLGDTLGVSFDGSDDYMSCSLGGIQDSVMAYVVFSINAGGWAYGRTMFAMYGTGTVELKMYATYPNIALYKSSYVGEISAGGTETIGIARIYHAYESSTRFWRFNDNSSNSWSGFLQTGNVRLGANYTSNGWGNCTIYEVILMEDRGNEDKIYEKLADKWL